VPQQLHKEKRFPLCQIRLLGVHAMHP
jgi:hypothetical protein